MDRDEKDIIDYLKGWPGSYVSGKEIARKVGGKKRFDEDRGWALPFLAQMVRRGVIETDHFGYYRLVMEIKKKKNHEQHVSPQILKILKSSGKSFEGITLDKELDEKSNAFPKPVPAPFNRDGSSNS